MAISFLTLKCSVITPVQLLAFHLRLSGGKKTPAQSDPASRTVEMHRYISVNSRSVDKSNLSANAAVRLDFEHEKFVWTVRQKDVLIFFSCFRTHVTRICRSELTKLEVCYAHNAKFPVCHIHMRMNGNQWIKKACVTGA